MKLINHLIIAVLAVSYCLISPGCKPVLLTDTDKIDFLEGGYLSRYPEVWMDVTNYLQTDSRIKVLLDSLGYGDADYDIAEATNKQTIRFYDRPERYLEVSKSSPPVWKEIDYKFHNPDKHRHIYNFENGRTFSLWRPTFDNIPDEQWYPTVDKESIFFCDYGIPVSIKKPEDAHPKDVYFPVKKQIFIFAMDEPNVPLAQSRLPWTPDKMITTEDKVYLLKRVKGPPAIRCEVYERQDRRIIFHHEYLIKPVTFGADVFFIVDYDPDNKFLLLTMQKWFTAWVPYYLFDLEEEKLTKIKDSYVLTFSGFLDPDFFEVVIRKWGKKDVNTKN